MQLKWIAEDVLRAVRGQSLHEQDWIATGVSIDSRTVQKGDLFIAIQGPSFDGHNYVHAAFDNGAVAAIVSSQPLQVPPNAPLIHVDDTLVALQDLGRVSRARSKAKIVAVTGSVGKTSTKEQLRLMLGAINDTFATEGSLNNHWGVPLSLARMPQDTKFGVFELGMNHAGELKDLSRIVQPAVAIITNVEAAHLEYFKNVEAIADAKTEIFEGMNPSGIAVLNRDNAHFARILAAAQTQGLEKSLTFGHNSKCDAHVLSFTPDTKGSNVEAIILGKKLAFRVGAPGAHLAFNALGGLLVCAALGVDLQPCADVLAAYRTPQGRGSQTTVSSEDGGSLTLIDESYNANPTSMKASFEVLGLMNLGPAGRRIAVLGDMLELGEKASELHAALCESLEDQHIDLVYCCGPLMKHLYQTLPAAMKGGYAADSTALAASITDDLRAGDVVMVKGSKGSRMKHIIESIKKLSNQRHKAVS